MSSLEPMDYNLTDHDLLVRLHENVRNLTISVDSGLKDHEGRIRVLETEKNRLQGAVKVLYALTLLLATVIGALWWVKR